MVRILTITSNPAVDLAMSVDHVVAGPKLRCSAPRVDPGGGGVNVARAIHKLGGSAIALVAAGGGRNTLVFMQRCQQRHRKRCVCTDQTIEAVASRAL